MGRSPAQTLFQTHFPINNFATALKQVLPDRDGIGYMPLTIALNTFRPNNLLATWVSERTCSAVAKVCSFARSPMNHLSPPLRVWRNVCNLLSRCP